jgi:hypothetical protein
MSLVGCAEPLQGGHGSSDHGGRLMAALAMPGGVFAQRTELLPILELRRDFRLAGRDFRPTTQLARGLQPEPEVELLLQEPAGQTVDP